jgi:hypothetical protein
MRAASINEGKAKADIVNLLGEWQCFFALNFAPKGLERLIQQLEG